MRARLAGGLREEYNAWEGKWRMQMVRAQGAIELNCAQFNCRHLAGQGATEYLVLLAVVLIVALVSVALLGFFPGMASDAQITQSRAYWQSAQPIQITEAGGRTGNNGIYGQLTIRNAGAYPIRLVGIVGADGLKATQFYTDTASWCSPAVTGWYSMVDYLYMAPGDQIIFATGGIHGSSFPGNFCRRHIFYDATTSGGTVGGATSLCQNSTVSPGTMVFPSFGFEYIEYLDGGQQITKRQIGKMLAFKCMEPY